MEGNESQEKNTMEDRRKGRYKGMEWREEKRKGGKIYEEDDILKIPMNF